MKYRYLYQDRENRNRKGEIDAANRADAYAQLRKAGIRPFHVIGDDPRNWRPLAMAAAIAIVFLALSWAAFTWARVYAGGTSARAVTLSDAEAREFRAMAAEAVERAPAQFRYNVWRGVNARLADRGLEPLPRPPDMVEEEVLLGW